MSEKLIKEELAKFSIQEAKLIELKNQYMSIKVNGIDDIDGYKEAREGHLIMVKWRTGLEAERKLIKAPVVAAANAIDGEAKRITKELLMIEEHLKSQRRIVEDEEERIRKQKEEAIRLDVERKKHAEEERLEVIRKEQEEKALALRQEEERLEVIRKEQEEKALALRQEEERAEQYRIKAIEDEKIRIDREKQRVVDIENAKKEAAERAEREAVERIERESREKEAAEKEAAEIKIREEALRPDIEKIHSDAQRILDFRFAEVDTDKAKNCVNYARGKMIRIAQDLMKFNIKGEQS